MAQATDTALIRSIQQVAHSLTGVAEDYNALLELVGNARFVLIGEASHGTHEFYQQRAEITKRLIQEKGFTVVAVEADWTDAYQVNRYVRGLNDDVTSEDALREFQQFPAWMWRNTDVVHFVDWLRQYNDSLTQTQQKIGFYGLDLYSMYRSIAAVLDYLDRIDPEAAKQARDRYSCFDQFGEDTQSYGYAANFELSETCEAAVINQLTDLQRAMPEYTKANGQVAEDEFFYAEQNARLVKNAETYYRAMFQGRASSWNIRDRHMVETLNHLVAHLTKHHDLLPDQSGKAIKAIVWAHNSHLGDARATDMSRNGEWNVGQLIREQYDQDVRLIGFSTYTGIVTAASNWHEPPQLKSVRPALSGSYEALFHDTGMPQFLINLQDQNSAVEGLQARRLQRAIGVIYRPETERLSHYFYSVLPQQFDAVIHIDTTRAVEPLDRTHPSDAHDAPETFPSAL